MNEHGIKELKELVDGCELLLFFILKQAADGIDFSDGAALIAKIMTDENFREKLVEAFGGIGELKDEVIDLDFSEGIELVQYVLEKFK